MSHPVKISEKLPWKYATYLFGLLILAISYWPAAVTAFYTPYIFNPISQLLRFLLGSIPFPIGELVYLLLIIVLIFNLLKWLRTNYKNFKNGRLWKCLGVYVLNCLVQWYLVFELIWGLNYQKMDPAQDFKLKVPISYSESQMDSLSLSLIKQLNNTRALLDNFDPKTLNFEAVLGQNSVEFAKNAKKWPFLKYSNASVKPALFPILGDFIGYTAFYQPLTGEAIVRGDLPKFTLPFTMSHEMAHQLGYASEEQANFIAYLMGMESKQPIFNYSSQLQLFTYAQFAHLNLIAKRGDFEMYKQVVARNKQLLSPQVFADRKEIKKFFLQKQDLQIQGTSEMYHQFLLWNKQIKGIESYNDVLLWVLAYEAKKIPSVH